MDQAQRAGVGGNETQLAALAPHAQMRNAAAVLVEVFDAQLGEFLAAQRVKQQHGEDRAVALSLTSSGRYDCCNLLSVRFFRFLKRPLFGPSQGRNGSYV